MRQPASTPRPHRRRRSRLASALTTTVLVTAAAATIAPARPASATDAPTPATMVAKMTGRNSVSATDTRWLVSGTDLGIAWDNGSGQTLTLFGDTFGDWAGPGGGGGDWRSNVLLRSNDQDLSDGITYDSAVEDRQGHAAELIPSKKVDGVEMTTIPTAAISVGKRQYMAYMSVRHWGPPGQWDTNFNQFAYSDDNGQTWSTEGAPRWTNNADGTDPFQMVAFARDQGYVYMFGTPNGRLGKAHVARAPERQLLRKSAWRYWDGKRWGTTQSAAAPIVDANVSELSVRKDEATGRWQMVYLEDSDIVLRQADSPTGPWTDRQVAVTFADHPGLYGGFIDPRSTSRELYLAVSQWDPYNVYLMRLTLDADGRIVSPNLLRDPGFERQSGTEVSSPWKCGGTCGVDKDHTIAYSGIRNGWVRAASGWNNLYQDFAVRPNTTYVMSGWLRTSSGAKSGYVGVRTPSGKVVSERVFHRVDGWTRYDVTFDSGDATALQAFAGIWADGDTWLQLDEVSVRAVP